MIGIEPEQRPAALLRGDKEEPYGIFRVRMRTAAAVMGFSGLLAQQLLLRELLIVFAGNELTIGLILACWLATEAAGTIWARRFGSARTAGPGSRSASTSDDPAALTHFVRFSVLFCLSLLPAIYAVRLIKPILGLSIGTVAGLGTAGIASLLVLAPVSLTHGALFTLGCTLWYRSTGGEKQSVDRTPADNIYILANVGTLAAGLLWTAALVRLPDSFQVATGIVFLNALTLLYLAKNSEAGYARRRVSALVLFAAGLLALGTGITGQLQQRSIATLWQHQNILHYENSMHGNIVITENQGQYAFFTDGTPAFMIPIPEVSLVEPMVHIPMTAHPAPQRILLIGGGAGGFVDAILLHPSVTRLDYLELDPRLLQLQRDLASRVENNPLDDPRVQLHAADTRAWLTAGNPRRYDLIFSRYHDPDNLHSSRYFSEEFFQLAAAGLTERGILVLGFPGMIGHLTEPLRDLAAGVYYSLRRVFPFARAFPGEAHSFLVASFDPGIVGLDPDSFADRLIRRDLLDAITLPWDVEHRLHPGLHEWFEDFTATASTQALRDFQPRALFLSVAHWSSLNAPLTARVLKAVYPMNPVLLVVGVLLVLLVSAFALNRSSPNRHTQVIPAVLATGFGAMMVNLSLLFTFQIAAGRLFGWLGLLTAAFIAGLGGGALYASYRLGRRQASAGSLRRRLIQTDLVVLLFNALLLILLPIAAPWLSVRIPPTLLRVAFFPLLLAGGAVCGAQFPLACRMLARADHQTNGAQKSGGDPGGSGLVCAADLIGGCLGGILGGVVLLPLVGVTGAGVIVGLLKAITLALLIQAPRTILLEADP